VELVLKNPKDKPPFIGILFDDQSTFSDRQQNREFVDEYKRLWMTRETVFKVQFEPYTTHVNIQLFCSNPISIRNYQKVKYNPAKLEEWWRLNRFIRIFNFGHIILNNNNHEVIKTEPKMNLFVLPVTRIDIKVLDSVYSQK
jgi:hypothetical protein